MSGITFYIVHVILILRLYALYPNKLLLYALTTLLCVCIAIHISIIAVIPFSYSASDFGLGVGIVCVPGDMTSLSLIWCV